MRCDEFYEKWRKCGNFCEKHPDTAAEIEALLDFVDEINEREDLSDEAKAAFAGTSARAVRPLIREPNPEIRDKAISHIGKTLTRKTPQGGQYTKHVTERDVSDVLEGIRKEVEPFTEAPNPEAPNPEAPKTSPVPHVSRNTGDNEWYTPKEYIDAARHAMGCIDVDPASTEEANAVVKAARFYTAEEDGLTWTWVGNIWMNPPYASDLIGAFTSKLCAEFQSGHVTQACVLVNNATETRWFQEMAMIANGIVFPAKRVRFWHPDKESAPLQGQAIIYLGNNAKAFYDNFSTFGVVCSVVH